MRPKVSTGVLTPKATRNKKNENLSEAFNDEFYEKLMSDPIKRKLVLQLITQEKDAIEEYKKNEEKKKLRALAGSPINKLQKRLQCESPTALLRRRALEQQKKDSTSESTSDRERTLSRQSSASSASPVPSPLPFDKLLDGVIAFVEVKSKDQDRSAGAKALMKSMGAVIRETFTKDVTHVIFKDGQFTTYQKARLMKVKLVSVLWLEACRRNNHRVSEKDYPALGTSSFDSNISSVCSQMQREYEEVIRDEVRRSLVTGSPLPSQKIEIERRKTLMAPSTSFQRPPLTIQDILASQDDEIKKITSQKRKTTNFDRPSNDMLESLTPELTSDDDSDVGIIDGHKSKNPKDPTLDDFLNTLLTDDSDNFLSYSKNRRKSTKSVCDMELTSICQNGEDKENKTNSPIDMELTNIISPRKSNKHTRGDSFYKNKTILLDENNEINSSKSINNSVRRKTILTNHDSSKSTNISDESVLKRINALKRPILNESGSTNTNMSALELCPSDDIQILSKNSPLRVVKPQNEPNNTDGTNMSSLNLVTSLKESSTGTNMSLLAITDKSKLEETDKNISTSRRSSTSSNSSEIDLRLPRKTIGAAPSWETLLPKRTPIRKSLNPKSLKAKSPANACDTNSLNTTANTSKSNASKNSSRSSFSPIDVSGAIKTLDKFLLPQSNITKRKKYTKKVEVEEKGNEKENEKDNSIQVNEELTKSSNKDPKKNSRRKSMCVPSIKPTHKEDPFVKKNSRKTINVLENLELPKKNLRSNSEGRNEEINKEKLNNDQDHSKRKESAKRSARTRKPTIKALEYQMTLSEQSSEETSLKGTSSKEKTVKKKSTKTDAQQTHVQSEESSGESPNKKVKRLRKLYNPDESLKLAPETDERERETRKEIVKKRKSDGGIDNVFVSPPLKVNKRNSAKDDSVDSNDSSVDPILFIQEMLQSDPNSNKKKKKNADTTKPRNSEADEQKSLLNEVLQNRNSPAKNLVTEKSDTTSTQSSKTPNQLTKPSKQPSRTPKEHPKTPKTPKQQSKKITSKSENTAVNRRKSIRLSQMKEIKFNEDGDEIEDEEENVFPVKSTAPIASLATPMRNRRSTMEFQKPTASTQKKKLANLKQPTIVCTKFHRPEVDTFEQVVRKLGKFKVQDEVTKTTTHLVAGEPKRTINMLRAMARGCWILKKEWLLKSLDKGRWLPEEDYEETEFSPAVQRCRLQRQAFGSSYTMDVLQDCGPIYISKASNPRCSDLKELVELCRGRIALKIEKASIIIGEYVSQEESVCVKESWLLDSITFNAKKKLKKYLMPNPQTSPIV